jgi:hypothetical protein
MDIEEIDARLKSAARQYRSANAQVARSSVRAIAAHAHAAAPPADTW